MYKLVFIAIAIFSVLAPTVHAQNKPEVLAKGVAVYGWKKGVETPLYVKNEHYLYPIASITKLVTAKVATVLYPENQYFLISKSAAATPGTVPGIVAGSVFSRNDLLKALIIRSSNDAATALLEPVGFDYFIAQMNDVIHYDKYTSRSFVNATGLDPKKSTKKLPNRMTPYQLSRLLSDIYSGDEFLKKIAGLDAAQIWDTGNQKNVTVINTNKLFRDESYKDRVLMSKTGLTNAAKQSVGFVTKGGKRYDYITVVLLGSTDREADSKKVLDWLALVDKN